MIRSVLPLLLLLFISPGGASSLKSIRKRYDEENEERRRFLDHANDLYSFLYLNDYGVKDSEGDKGGNKNAGDDAPVVSVVKGLTLPLRNPRFRKPPNDDFTFIKDGLFTDSCESQGTFQFDIEIERDVGNVSNLFSTGSIKETMFLEGAAYFQGDSSKLCKKVYFNNRKVAYFNGIEDAWSMQRAMIDTSWINFASFRDGVRFPGINTVRIILGECDPIFLRNEPQGTTSTNATTSTISTTKTKEVKMAQDGTESSCVILDDWMAINLRRSPSLPILLLHGFGSSSDETWGKLWRPQLTARGIPYDGTFDMGPRTTIQSNAKMIGPRVAQLKERWGVKKVKLVCHSKGGVDARHYVEEADNVLALIQIATPNRGTWLSRNVYRLADGALGPPVLISLLIGGSIDNDDRNIGGALQMAPFYMRVYNKVHDLNRNVRHFIQAGDYSAKGLRFWKRLKWRARKRFFCRSRDCDDLVTVRSAFALADDDAYSDLWTKDRYRCRGKNNNCRHNKIRHSLEAFNREPLQFNVIENLRPNGATARRALLEDNGDDEGDDTSPITVATESGILENTKSANILFLNDEPTLLIVTVYFGPGEGFHLSLSTPSGAKLMPDTETEILDDPSNDIVTDGTFDEVIQSLPADAIFFDSETDENGEIFSSSFFITTAEVGTWTAHIAAIQNESGEKPFVLTVEYVLSTLTFEARLDRDTAPVGKPLLLTVNLFDGAEAVLKAEVVATVHRVKDDGSAPVVATINMLDGGDDGDVSSNDGVYTAVLQLAERSQYFIHVAAKGARLYSNASFTREDNVLATIVARASILGVNNESAVDLDADGLYDFLSVAVQVHVEDGGEYRLYGILEDSQGNEYHSGVSTQLAEGKQVVMLTFDGAEFVKNQVNGPLTLAVIRLAEGEKGAVVGLVDELCVNYTTQTYSHDDFEIKESERETPTAVCKDIEVSTDPGRCFASSVSINAGSSTAEGAIEGRLTQLPEGPYGFGETAVYLDVISIYGFVDSCFGNVLVKDSEPPSIACNVRDITSAEATPVTFVSSATDNCDGTSSVSTTWTGYDCWKTNKKGERIRSSCLIQLQENEARIQESGGKGTSINLYALAEDSSGNMVTETCSVAVVETQKGSKSSKAGSKSSKAGGMPSMTQREEDGNYLL